MRRNLDLLLAFFATLFIALPALVIALCILIFDGRPIIFWSERVGRQGSLFKMPKFRTMRIGTPVVATHLVADPEKYITKLGKHLRVLSLDEVPQVFCILRGDMSFIGPRPALPSQLDLLELRKSAGVDAMTPGLTGWAQVNGRDKLTIDEKVSLEAEYLHRKTLLFDLKIILITVWVLFQKGHVSH